MGNDRPCPELEVVQAYLHDNTDFIGDIGKIDRVCFTCYKSHVALLNPTSKDDDLRPLVESVITGVGMGHDIISNATPRCWDNAAKQLSNFAAFVMISIAMQQNWQQQKALNNLQSSNWSIHNGFCVK